MRSESSNLDQSKLEDMNQNNTDMEIGIAELTYNEDGTTTSATFKPTMVINADQALLERLATISGPDESILQSNARMVFAQWFNKSNEIELADPSEAYVADEIVECERYASGQPKRCVIRFIYRNLKGQSHEHQ